jgi:hypothetical protein
MESQISLTHRKEHDVSRNYFTDPAHSAVDRRTAYVAAQQKLGYGPTGGLGLIVIILVILVLLGKI